MPKRIRGDIGAVRPDSMTAGNETKGQAQQPFMKRDSRGSVID